MCEVSAPYIMPASNIRAGVQADLPAALSWPLRGAGDLEVWLAAARVGGRLEGQVGRGKAGGEGTC